MVIYLSIIGRLLTGLEVRVLFVGSGRGGRVLKWSAVVAVWSFLVAPVAAAGVLCRGGVPFMVLVYQEGVWLRWCC